MAKINCPVCEKECNCEGLESHVRIKHNKDMDMKQFLLVYPDYKPYIGIFNPVKPKCDMLWVDKVYTRRVKA